MREDKWLAGTDPGRMLEFLRRHGSDRKCRLLVCGVYRTLWPGPAADGYDTAVDVAERFADGEIGEVDRAAAYGAAEAAIHCGIAPFHGMPSSEWLAPGFDRKATLHDLRGRFMAWRCVGQERSLVLGITTTAPHLGERLKTFIRRTVKRLRHGVRFDGPLDPEIWTALIWDIYGNPFRPVSPDPRWLTPTTIDLARTVYEDRAFDRLPILADALEEVGCDSGAILAHLRGPGPHVRGCWALDLVLGKQ